MHSFSTLDYVIFALYAIVILSVGLFVSRSKKDNKTAEDYFLASKSLPWWAIGASLIAANISAEQFIGMSGSGFALGLAIASYEWMAALTLIIVGKYFLPIFIEKGLYTIPEFIEKRYSTNLKSILAIFWVALFVFVNLTSVLFLGGKALQVVLGVDPVYAMIGLALFAAAYSLWGGLSAVAWTDVIQVALLVVGGLITAYIALDHVTPNGGVINGLQHIFDVAPGHFKMILDKSHPEYMNLPGIAVLVGGLWVANLYYWGFNQYIIQRTLAAKSLKESQKGIVFAAFLKMIVPILVVIPGIVAYVMYQGGNGTAVIDGVKEAFVGADGNIMNDNAYPWLIKTFIPSGIKGLVVAALAAAIVSSLASMLNSTATIFTMDIYKQNINKNASQKQLVNVGRISAAVALVIALFVAPALGNINQMFQYIQEYTGLVSPGILAVFMMGLFYKRATNKGAIWGILLSAVIAFYFKVGPNGWMADSSISSLFVILPWMHQMMITWIVSMIIIAVISYFDNKGVVSERAIITNSNTFKTDTTFNLASYTIIIMLVVLYALFW
ncbi:sodium/sugar symporter [Capnocytophaga canimorsus]|uniref:Sodium/glucose cotransporter n=2 Tax=Capnocytophaga canimorsus TaxID=28188 RepID=A0A0B7HQ06_9FLAO|nr:sodium/sugar symporter [Capnocytophaga canimorsus]ATA77136.1 sodium/glucose cotransporter [Capnocytophaga canimorsus]PJI83720.1 SSS family solute:Na+ symporter [Capnocytophaga canimorsus]CEN41400.1 Sodium/glucose cotransporter [Capnocytophaga canimorsus]STA72355.1 Na(+)/glucose symporter [Capnocytophaga canimorsus]GJQ03868.1 transporter [Capnocytophaga canimorsus]